MSILFEALNRAAQDYRQRQGAEGRRPSFPSLEIRRHDRRGPFLALAALGGAVLLALALWGAGLLRMADPVPLPLPPPVASAAPLPAAAPADTASAPAPRKRSGLTPPPAGIALPESRLADLPETPLETEVLNQVETLPLALPEGAAQPPETPVAPSRVMPDEGRLSLAQRLREAHEKLAAGEPEAARLRFQEVLALAPRHREAWEGVMYALRKAGLHAEAQATALRWLKARPGDDEARAMLAATLEEWGTPEAIEGLREMILTRSQFAPARAAMARLLTRMGDLSGALPEWQRAADLDPGRSDYLLGKAVTLDRMGETRAALEAYRLLPPPVTPEVRERMAFLKAQAKRKGLPDLPPEREEEGEEEVGATPALVDAPSP